MKLQDALSWVVVFACFFAAFSLYSSMPEGMVSHWNGRREVDGFMAKTWGVFFLPVVILGVFLLLLLIPHIAVYKKNIADFTPYYVNLRLLFVLFLAGVYATTLLWNLGNTFNLGYYIIPALSVLFYYIGHTLKYLKRNYFIGVRTPWTLSSDIVWGKTHSLASKVFKVAAVVMLAGLLAPAKIVWFVLVPVLGGALYLLVYSYVEYRRVENR